MKYWLMAVAWALICFSGIPLIFSMMRDNSTNLAFIIGGLGGLIFMVLGLAMTMSKKPKQVNPFFK